MFSVIANSQESMAKILLGMSKAEWAEIDCLIETIEEFEDVFKHMSKEAQDDFNAYVGDMVGDAIDHNDDTLGDVSMLKELLKIDDNEKLQFDPDAMCSLLQSYVIGQHEECKCIEDRNNRNSTPACQYCFWRPSGHKPI